jgi:hypothetical protein
MTFPIILPHHSCNKNKNKKDLERIDTKKIEKIGKK